MSIPPWSWRFRNQFSRYQESSITITDQVENCQKYPSELTLNHAIPSKPSEIKVRANSLWERESGGERLAACESGHHASQNAVHMFHTCTVLSRHGAWTPGPPALQPGSLAAPCGPSHHSSPPGPRRRCEPRAHLSPQITSPHTLGAQPLEAPDNQAKAPQ